MFSYDSLRYRRRLEDFLNSDTNISSPPSEEEKSNKTNFVTQIVNYFTKNSKIGYTYKMNESGDDLEYNIPRSFSKDIRNIRNYFATLFSMDE
jgi:hypothetical protein